MVKGGRDDTACVHSDPQVRQILPGSRFIYDLATWNQGGDDLRGVDAISVAGSVTGGSDGLVPVPSASLSFAGDPARFAAGLRERRKVACPDCRLSEHETDATHCRRCGGELPAD